MSSLFEHCALSLSGERPLIYTAFSKHYFYYRLHISRFVLEQGSVPLNPFLLFDYFLLDTVPRDLVRDANNSIVKHADALWAFGPISNGVLAELQIAHAMKKPIRYFKIAGPHEIVEESLANADLEEEVREYRDQLPI